MRLSSLVEVAVNNEDCVVLKVKGNVRMELIALGCFDGDEEMFRITKGEQHTATIFSGGKPFSWNWGVKGYTMVSDKTRDCGRLIQSCVEEDFGIYIGEDKGKIKETLHIKTLDDKKGKKHQIKILYWPKREKERCNIHKDGEHFKWFANVAEARQYVSEYYAVQNQHTTEAVTGCIVEAYEVITV